MKTILPAKPSITQLEVDYVNDAIRNGWGDQCYNYIYKFKKSIKNYFNCNYVWPTSSCHGALHIVLMALEVGPGDEVLVPDLTWVGSVAPISWVGATPVFVESLKDTWCIAPHKIEEKITDKTKAIIIVHLYGNLCEMDEIMALGAKYGLPVIEDAAEAIGSEYKGQKAGSIADFGVFSFHGTKTVTTGEGGAIISNRTDIEKKISTIENQGRKPGAKFYWVDEIGLKYKLSNIQAALGVAQFQRINELVEKKRINFKFYKDLLSDLPDIQMNVEQKYTKNSYWMPSIAFGDTWSIDIEKLITNLNSINISIRPFFYPVSKMPMYHHKKELNKKSPSIGGINLPSYHEMSQDDFVFVTSEIKKAIL